MKKVFLFFSIICFLSISIKAQVQYKEGRQQGKGESTTITGSAVGMYNGTQSEEASKYYKQGEEFSKENDLESAEKAYLKAIKIDPEYVEAYDNLGIVYRRMGDLDKAKKYYLKSIDLYFDGITAHQNLAVVYTIEKDFNSAIKEYEVITELNPNSPEGYFGLANSYMTLRKFDEALENAQKAVSIYEQTESHYLGEGYYLVGLIHYYKENTADAKHFVKLALAEGYNVSPRLINELFPEGVENSYELNTAESYKEYEEKFQHDYSWLLNTSLNVDDKKRKALNKFILEWVSGCPYIEITLSDQLSPYVDSGNCLVIFLGGWAVQAITNKNYDNKFENALAGTKNVIYFYEKNKKSLGKISSIEKLVKMKKKGELEDYIKSNLP